MFSNVPRSAPRRWQCGWRGLGSRLRLLRCTDIVNDMSIRGGGFIRAGILALLAVLLIAACGGSGSSTTGGEDAVKEPSREFAGPTGKNKLVQFGVEASEAERRAASAVLDQSFEARASADFAAQCATLTAKEMEKVAGAGTGAGKKGASTAECTVKLKELADPLTRSEPFRKDKLEGDVTAMRVKGIRGFAFFHGTDGRDWMMPLEKEGAIWKVAAIQEEEVPSKASPKPSKAPPSKAASPESQEG